MVSRKWYWRHLNGCFVVARGVVPSLLVGWGRDSSEGITFRRFSYCAGMRRSDVEGCSFEVLSGVAIASGAVA